MARLRAVVTLPWTSGLPEDVSVNTFHFLTGTNPASVAELNEIVTDLTAFYNSDFGTPGNPVGGYLSPLVSRDASACSIEIFDLADVPPRQPVHVGTFTLVASADPNLLPPEVALCASFQGDPISGVPQSRRRGRVFIGPLNMASDAATTGRPTAAFQEALVDAMEGIVGLLVGSGVAWTVYSRTSDAMSAVSNGWVDDEWDTVRSRGRDATSRLSWGV